MLNKQATRTQDTCTVTEDELAEMVDDCESWGTCCDWMTDAEIVKEYAELFPESQ